MFPRIWPGQNCCPHLPFLFGVGEWGPPGQALRPGAKNEGRCDAPLMGISWGSYDRKLGIHLEYVASGKLRVCYWKWSWKSLIYPAIKYWCSIAMLVSQRVSRFRVFSCSRSNDTTWYDINGCVWRWEKHLEWPFMNILVKMRIHQWSELGFPLRWTPGFIQNVPLGCPELILDESVYTVYVLYTSIYWMCLCISPDILRSFFVCHQLCRSQMLCWMPASRLPDLSASEHSDLPRLVDAYSHKMWLRRGGFHQSTKMYQIHQVQLNIWLVVWNIFYFSTYIPHIGNNQIPTDELIFFRGVKKPPARLLLTIINHH